MRLRPFDIGTVYNCASLIFYLLVCMCVSLQESVSDHLAKLRTLKYLEEYEQEVELSDYDLRAHLAQQSWRNGRFVYSLRVEGLLEGRPSVITGDKIIVSLADSKQRFEGRVVAIQHLTVLLSFRERFNHNSFNVRDKGGLKESISMNERACVCCPHLNCLYR